MSDERGVMRGKRREVRAVDELGVIRYRGTEFAVGWEMARRRVLISGRDRKDLVVVTPAGEQYAVPIGFTRPMRKRMGVEGLSFVLRPSSGRQR